MAEEQGLSFLGQIYRHRLGSNQSCLEPVNNVIGITLHVLLTLCLLQCWNPWQHEKSRWLLTDLFMNEKEWLQLQHLTSHAVEDMGLHLHLQSIRLMLPAWEPLSHSSFPPHPQWLHIALAASAQALLLCIVKLPEQAADEKRRSKYPYAACEVLCCEVEGILGPLAADPDLLTILFSLLQAPAPLNATLAGYFARVLASLLSKQPAPLHAFMQVRLS